MTPTGIRSCELITVHNSHELLRVESEGPRSVAGTGS